jgi:hypothetical protein
MGNLHSPSRLASEWRMKPNVGISLMSPNLSTMLFSLSHLVWDRDDPRDWLQD